MLRYHGGTHHLSLFALAGFPSKRQHLCQALCMCCAWGWIEGRIRQFRDGATDYNLKYPANVCWFKRVGGTGRQRDVDLLSCSWKSYKRSGAERSHTHIIRGTFFRYLISVTTGARSSSASAERLSCSAHGAGQSNCSDIVIYYIYNI